MKKSILLFAIIFSLFSCSKDDEPTPTPVSYQEENFLSGYLSTAGFTTKTDVINGTSSEFGIEFTPLVKGKINAIIVNIPNVNSALKVTIWDATTKTVLLTELVNVTSSNSNVTKSIEAFNLEKNKKYAITMNSNDFHSISKPDNSNISYPITSKNIRVESYFWVDGTTQTYPIYFPLNYYGGDLSFNFQQME